MAMDGAVHVLGEAREALSLGQAPRRPGRLRAGRGSPGSWGQDPVSQQQAQQVAVPEGHLVAHDDRLALWFWGSRISEGFRALQFLHLVVLAPLVVGADEGAGL